MLTLATAFFTYAIVEYLGANGLLSSLIFEIVLGNEKEILNVLKQPSRTRNLCIDVGLMRFEEEIAFAIRSFFFMYLGLLTVAIDIYSLFWELMLSFPLLLIRYGIVRIGTMNSPLRKENSVMSIVLTYGLVAAILATIPMQYGLLYADLYLNITVIVIITIAIFSTIGVFLLSRWSKDHDLVKKVE